MQETLFEAYRKLGQFDDMRACALPTVSQVAWPTLAASRGAWLSALWTLINPATSLNVSSVSRRA